MSSKDVLAFHPVNNQLAISTRSVTEMLGERGEALTFVLFFDQEDGAPVKLEVGGTALSPLESFDHDDAAVEAACSFVRFPEKLKALQPPYKKGTKMHVLVRRDSREFFELSFKIEKVRSPVFVIHSPPGRDFLAVRTPELKQVLAGNIDFKNLEEYLAAFHAHGPPGNRCGHCRQRCAAVIFRCNHATFCLDCDRRYRTSVCPHCNEESGTGVPVRRSLYCMACPHKTCTRVGAFFQPCFCMVACQPAAARATHCPNCGIPIEEVVNVRVV
ncbi:hypothetical protein M3Y99_00246900 [Aphelenchoides fujianensis]|nr:hypothetical protein M3Y99_00246900 [Aphelenchoides fujianensis]